MRFRIRTIGPILTGVALLFAASSCADVEGDTQSSDNAALGDALPGTNGTTFAAAKANFAAQEGAPDGLGPIFNERSCMLCHQTGAVGGAGENIERRYGTLTNGVFDPLANTGGSLRQLFSLGVFTVGNGQNCQSGADANPAPGATIFAGRVTTPLFGLGLVDSLPDSAFDTLASREPAAIRGIVNRVATALPNPLDPAQTTGGTRVGRFGWKAGVPNLGQFSADAYLNEMGITTSSCIRGTPNLAFATENRANRAPTNAIINGCPDDQVPGTDDDLAEETNNCAGGVNELQDDVANFTFFMAHLAPPCRSRSRRARRRTGAGRCSIRRRCSVRAATARIRTSSARRRPAASRRGSASPRTPTSSCTTWGRRVTASATRAIRWRSPTACGPRRCGACGRATSCSTTAARRMRGRHPAAQRRRGRSGNRGGERVQRAQLGAKDRPGELPADAVGVARSRATDEAASEGAASLGRPRSAVARRT